MFCLTLYEPETSDEESINASLEILHVTLYRGMSDRMRTLVVLTDIFSCIYGSISIDQKGSESDRSWSGLGQVWPVFMGKLNGHQNCSALTCVRTCDQSDILFSTTHTTMFK